MSYTYSDIQDRIQVVGFSDPNIIHNALTVAYEGSDSLAMAINSWLYEHSSDIVINFTSGDAYATGFGSGEIFIDPIFCQQLMYVTTYGAAVRHSLLSVLVHELGHAIIGSADNVSFDNLKGNNVIQANSWYSDLGIPLQAGYVAQSNPEVDPDPDVLAEGLNYTGGVFLENAIVDRGTNLLGIDIDFADFDLKLEGVSGRSLFIGSSRDNIAGGTDQGDFLYGQGGDDTLSGHGGFDRLYGGDGNDTLIGGAGNDTFFGGMGDDTLWGGEEDSASVGTADGFDIADYSRWPGRPVTIDFIGTALSYSLTVSGSSHGRDTLHSIEKIIGTTGFDYLRITGGIMSSTDLLIDANGGQTPSPLDSILNGISATTSLNISIDGDGDGYVQSVGAGKIDLTGFHTQIISSSFDDQITDNSSGKKRIDGGGGDDEISTSSTTGDVTIYGGDGNDIITGGAGNDVIFGDSSLSNSSYSNFLSGGAGSDLIYSTSAFDWVDGGEGSDYIQFLYAPEDPYDFVELGVRGGEGDDVIFAADQISDIQVVFAAGDGRDAVDVPQMSIGGEGVSGTRINVLLEGLDEEDISFVVDAQPDQDGNYTGFANIALVIDSTGDSIYFENQYIQARQSPSQMAGISFEAAQLLDIDFLDEATNTITSPGWVFDFSYGSTSSYAVDLSSFNSAVAPSAEETTGTSGDDNLSGGYGDDSLSGGTGDDTFQTSGGSDAIDGGEGFDTLYVFGARENFTVTQNGSQTILSDQTGLEGEIALTGVESVFSITDGKAYPIEGLVWGATDGSDEIFGTQGDDTIDGLGGDDALFGEEGNDTLIGGDGWDYLDGGPGGDTMIGGADGDFFIVDNVNDFVVEAEDEGYDFVEASISYTLDANVEGLYLWGEVPINGTGNSLDNEIYGDLFDNTLLGLDGDDFLEGGDTALDGHHAVEDDQVRFAIHGEIERILAIAGDNNLVPISFEAELNEFRKYVVVVGEQHQGQILSPVLRPGRAVAPIIFSTIAASGGGCPAASGRGPAPYQALVPQ